MSLARIVLIKAIWLGVRPDTDFGLNPEFSVVPSGPWSASFDSFSNSVKCETAVTGSVECFSRWPWRAAMQRLCCPTRSPKVAA